MYANTSNESINSAIILFKFFRRNQWIWRAAQNTRDREESKVLSS